MPSSDLARALAVKVGRWLGRGVRRCLLAAAVLIGTVVAWGVVVEPRLIDEVHEDVALKDLPAEWDGRAIAVIADLQLGMWLANRDTIRRSVERIVRARPAAVLIAGDFIYFASDDNREDTVEELASEQLADSVAHAADAASLVQPLAAAGIPTFAVLGNHDYAMMWPTSVPRRRIAAEVAASLEAVGIRVLHNQALALDVEANPASRTPGRMPLYLVGVGAHFPGEDRPAAAVAAVPPRAARIVFMHNPSSFPALPPGTAPLAIAGHTHGGQVRLPFLPHWSWLSLATDRRITADGWADDFGQPGNRLYVNRGIGFSTMPVRINCRPEVTFFTLRSPARRD